MGSTARSGRRCMPDMYAMMAKAIGLWHASKQGSTRRHATGRLTINKPDHATVAHRCSIGASVLREGAAERGVDGLSGLSSHGGQAMQCGRERWRRARQRRATHVQTPPAVTF